MHTISLYATLILDLHQQSNAIQIPSILNYSGFFLFFFFFQRNRQQTVRRQMRLFHRYMALFCCLSKMCIVFSKVLWGIQSSYQLNCHILRSWNGLLSLTVFGYLLNFGVCVNILIWWTLGFPFSCWPLCHCLSCTNDLGVGFSLCKWVIWSVLFSSWSHCTCGIILCMSRSKWLDGVSSKELNDMNYSSTSVYVSV